jgi:hypothetical protein
MLVNTKIISKFVLNIQKSYPKNRCLIIKKREEIRLKEPLATFCKLRKGAKT